MSKRATSEVERALARDLLVLLAKEQRTFLRFLALRVRSETDAEDLLQQALLRAAEKIETLREHDRLEAWFYRILRRTVADHLAHRAMESARIETLRAEAESGTDEQVATCACSLGILGRLPLQHQEMLRRVDIDEESIVAVAASLGITANNATVRLHRARKELRAELLRFCRTRSVSSCLTCDCEGSAPVLEKADGGTRG
jgi:RNA polymerase sigma-70 factor (ECF subfamily)